MIYIYLVAAVLLAGIDQLLKYVAITSFKVQNVPIIDDVLILTYTENTGAAFSILRNHTWILAVVTAILLIVLLALVFIKKIKSHYLLINFALVFSGGLGNLIDRIFRGFVVDFIYFKPINFPVFNFADICVFCGAVMFIIYILVLEPKIAKNKSNKIKEDNIE